jgi:hypothetical protein
MRFSRVQSTRSSVLTFCTRSRLPNCFSGATLRQTTCNPSLTAILNNDLSSSIFESPREGKVAASDDE